MLKFTEHPIVIAVAGTVIGGLILASILDLLKPIAAGAWAWCLAVLGFFLKSFQTPLWLLCILAIGWLLFIYLFALRWRDLHSDEREPPWFRYTSDTFVGVKWRWGYYSNTGNVKDVVPQCPQDRTILVENFQDSYLGGVVLECETCGKKYRFKYRDLQRVKDMVLRQIARKIETDEWKEAV